MKDSIPYFDRFLEGQKMPDDQDDRHDTGSDLDRWTQKWPSDTDETLS